MFKSNSAAAFPVGTSGSITCRECGCTCSSCSTYSNSLDLHREIEELRSKLLKSDSLLEQLRGEYDQVRQCSEGQMEKLQDEHAKLNDRYARLMESYKKTQKVNHDLEDKLLKVVQCHAEERRRLETQVATLTSQLMDAKYSISDLEQEAERYRNDCFMAVQLLQCKPSNFVSHKLKSLPLDIQQRVKVHLTREEIIQMEENQEEAPQKMIRVPMPTFPPTAMVYSVNKKSQQDLATRLNEDGIPTDLIAKVLAPSDMKRKPSRFYVCNRCSKEFQSIDMATQTVTTGNSLDSSINNGYPRAVVANMKTNPPTIMNHYPKVHASKSRVNSFSSDCV